MLSRSTKSLLALAMFAVVSFAIPLSVYAESINETVTDLGNRDVRGDLVLVDEETDGDLFAVGNEVIVSESVVENLTAAGGGVLINGNVEGDLLVLGGYVIINGNVDGDIRVYGGQVFINSEYVLGDLFVNSGQLAIDDTTVILGEKVVNAGQELTNVANNPRTLEEYSKTWKNLFNVKQVDFDLNLPTSAATLLTLFGVGSTTAIALIATVVMFIGQFLAAYIVLKFFPVFSEEVLVTMKNNVPTSVGVGFLTLILAPILAIVLLLSFVGIPVLMLFIGFVIMLSMLVPIYVDYTVGRYLMKRLGQDKAGRAMTLFVGMVVVKTGLWLLTIIPVVGGLTALALTTALNAWGLGAVVYMKTQSLKKKPLK